MSKRPHRSETTAPASENLVLQQIDKGNDSVSVRSTNSEPVNDVKRQKKTRNRPCRSTPAESLVEILLFADRDALDALQLVCHFMLEFIRDREAKGLPLRSISRVNIGKRDMSLWKAVFEVVCGTSSGKEAFPDSVKELVSYLRLAVCDSVILNLQWSTAMNDSGIALRAIFGDLVVPRAFSVDVLTICVDYNSAIYALRAIEALKPVRKVVLKDVKVYLDWARIFDEPFFFYSAKCGVRSIVFDSSCVIGEGGLTDIIEIGALSALSFGFAEPTTGGDRSITGVDLELQNGENFLAMLVEKASELDGRQHIDFKYTIADYTNIEPAGFEKYQQDECTWVIDDLENGITVKVVEFEHSEDEHSTEIHVFSSV